MVGLLFLGAVLCYLLLSVAVVKFVIKRGKSHRSRVILGVVSAIAMFHLVFWDWAPTLITQQYYCSKEAKFQGYVSFEEWNAKNPGVAETLKRSLNPYTISINANKPPPWSPPGVSRHWFNQRFYNDYKREKVFHSLHKVNKVTVDSVSGEIISQSVDFEINDIPLGLSHTWEEVRQNLVFTGVNKYCGEKGEAPTDLHSKHNYLFFDKGSSK